MSVVHVIVTARTRTAGEISVAGNPSSPLSTGGAGVIFERSRPAAAQPEQLAARRLLFGLAARCSGADHLDEHSGGVAGWAEHREATQCAPAGITATATVIVQAGLSNTLDEAVSDPFLLKPDAHPE